MIITKEQISQCISALRLPLAIAVVMIHSQISGYSSAVFIHSLQNIIFLAVPCFFIISGYNFSKSKKNYKDRIKNRLKTILLPYIIWNLIAYMVSMRYRGFYLPNWNILIANPINFPLWYLRDLFILCLLYPYISWLASKIKGILFILLAFFLCYEEFIFPFIGLRYNSILFFGIGVLFNMYIDKDKLFIPKLLEYSIYIITIILFVITVYYREYFNVDQYRYIIYLIFGCATIFLLLIKKISHLNQYYYQLGNLSFFIFASHTVLINGTIKYLFSKFQISAEIKIFLITIFTTLTCILLFYALKTLFPAILKVLNGGKI